ncbi:hypothetical protein QC763_600620 [Podospora pseudopauciseta]|uniref:Zn(2)-C6 fungal-type domain-containing protein n=1 Tax=Podospora pseudopauciseta TaxID=2093780 RepID=A0ABR0H588_9PEZI|nr:hypothetical protein QC763_600620 [Podospora pseudopauciseta]
MNQCYGQLPMRDFLGSSDAPQIPFEDDLFPYLPPDVQDEGIAFDSNHACYEYDFPPIYATSNATNVPISGLAFPINIASPPSPLSEHPVPNQGWEDSLRSHNFLIPAVNYSGAVSNPFAISLSMNDANTYMSVPGQRSGSEPRYLVPNETHTHDNFIPCMGLQLDIPDSGTVFLPEEDPDRYDLEEVFSMFYQGNRNLQRMSPQLIEATLGIPPDSNDSQHLICSQNNERQSDQDSATLDALSAQPQIPSSPSTLAQSPDALSESATSLSAPRRDRGIPFTSRPRLLVAPPGFSHSHILVITSNPGSLPASLWDGARLAELEKDIRLKALDIESQIPKSQDSSSRDFSQKRQRVDNQPQSNSTQKVSEASGVPTISSYPALFPCAASVPTSDPLPSAMPHSRVPKRKANAERQATSQVKKESTCLLCRVMREKCSDGTPCLRCVRVLQHERSILRVPCQPATLDDIELYRRRTQIGLFVYYYEQSSESDLPRRSASIVDTNPLESQLSQNCPLTVADTFAVHEFGTFQRFAPNLLNDANRERELATQHAPTSEDLSKSAVLARYLELHLASIIETLGTNNSFIAATLKVAERYSRPTGSKKRTMLRHALYIFAARFLRRTYWVQVDTVTENYRVAWMDAPWRALPVSTPRSLAEAETLNDILKDHLRFLEKSVIHAFTKKIYARKKEDWFEIFLVTFIFQVILSENLEMSFYSRFPGLEKPIECPWSTFGGLRSYSSKRIASYFSAINGRDPFLKPGARAWEGFGDTERTYLDQCGILLKEGYTKRDDLGFRRSASMGDADSPGSWWKWAVETILGNG